MGPLQKGDRIVGLAEAHKDGAKRGLRFGRGRVGRQRGAIVIGCVLEPPLQGERPG